MTLTEIGYNYTRCDECGISWQMPDKPIRFCDQIRRRKTIALPYPWRGYISKIEGLKIEAWNRQIFPIKDIGHFYVTFNDNSFHIKTLNCKKSKIKHETEELRVYQAVPRDTVYNYTRCNECGMGWQGPNESIRFNAQTPCKRIAVHHRWEGRISRSEGLEITANNRQVFYIKDFGHFYITFKNKSFTIQTINCKRSKIKQKTEELRVYQIDPEAKPEGPVGVYTYSRSKECGMYCKGPKFKLHLDLDSVVDTPVKLSFPPPWKGIFSRKEGLKIEGSGKNIFTISQKNVDFSITFVEGQDPKFSIAAQHACADPECQKKKKQEPTESLNREHLTEANISSKSRAIKQEPTESLNQVQLTKANISSKSRAIKQEPTESLNQVQLTKANISSKSDAIKRNQHNILQIRSNYKGAIKSAGVVILRSPR